MAAGAISAGTVAGALLVGAAGPAQASPGEVGAQPPAAVHMAGTPLGLPAAVGNRVAIDRAPADTVFATDWRSAPMPQWGRHHWWRHHHFWHRWWWWW
ncbi:hypothetical protein ABW16_07720 [Mycolicibacter heraklionensis]|uniref:Secreted protein n=1 Tax=Mycolicibacter heraklionensis TaxID=512402 RepID=A0ABR5FHN2_9MYCO|nr:hypothetical protein ABW16_07720 [Mycolicibacter heraklionensis]